MFALIKRNTKIYFANKPGVIMSCFGALISFVIYIGFLQQNLVNSWQHVSHAKQLLDLWMLGGIVSIAGITTSFQALGQMVNDKENRAIDDMKLTALTPISESHGLCCISYYCQLSDANYYICCYDSIFFSS